MDGMIGLKNARKARGLTVQELACATGIKAEALTFFESGKGSPDLAVLRKLSAFFSLSIDYLISGKNFEE